MGWFVNEHSFVSHVLGCCDSPFPSINSDTCQIFSSSALLFDFSRKISTGTFPIPEAVCFGYYMRVFLILFKPLFPAHSFDSAFFFFLISCSWILILFIPGWISCSNQIYFLSSNFLVYANFPPSFLKIKFAFSSLVFQSFFHSHWNVRFIFFKIQRI